MTWGGVRDLDQISGIKNAQFYYRGSDPTPFRESMLVGINVPINVGMAVVLPGDVVLGTEAGIIFIPAHLAETCVIDAEKTHVRDIFGFMRLHEGKYTAAQIDSAWNSACGKILPSGSRPHLKRKNTVISISQKNWRMHGRVLSPDVLQYRVKAKRPVGNT